MEQPFICFDNGKCINMNQVIYTRNKTKGGQPTCTLLHHVLWPNGNIFQQHEITVNGTCQDFLKSYDMIRTINKQKPPKSDYVKENLDLSSF